MAILAGLLGLLAIVTAARHAVPRRLALRSIARRPGETVLVVLGSLLGTAIITGSFIVGDTLDSSIRASAETQLGPIDETVTGFGTESLPALRRALEGLEDEPRVDGVTFAIRAAGTAAARIDTDDVAVQPRLLVLEMDLEEAGSFGGDPAATGLDGAATPAEGEAVITEDLAAHLEVGRGDEITLFAYGSERELRVTGLVPRLGVAGYTTEFSAESFNVFVAPGTLEELVAAAPPDLEASPPTSLAFVSNEGGVFEGEEPTDEVVPLIRERIAGLEGVDVVDSKRDVVEAADRSGSQFSELFLSIGSFAVIAGILLLVNIFVMLSEERKGELGMMRAVGMRRGQLVRSFYIEGSLYGLVASAIGAVAGIGVGAAIVRVAADIFSGAGEFSLELVLSAPLVSIVGGFLIGLAISLLTALFTSARISRLNIIRAIRDLPEPPVRRRRLRGLVLGAVAVVVGGGMTAFAISEGEAASAFAGPGILALGLGALLWRLVPRRPLGSVLGLAVLGWGIFGPTLAPDVFGEADIPVFVIQGVLLTASAVAVLGFNQESVGHAVRAVAGGARNLAARLGLAYPLAKRFRTVMTLSMYALVVFTLVFISVLSNIFGGQVEDFTRQEAGGYDLLVRSSAANPLTAEAAAAEDGVEAASPIRYAAFSVEFSTELQPEAEPWALSGIEEGFLAQGPPALEKLAPE
ncbi:MAG TPA: ABC transporter permease, partial [Actinomycetota bacterium]